MKTAHPAIGDKHPPPDRARATPEARGPDLWLIRLAAAIDAARTLGIPTDEAEAVRVEAVERLGFPADVYVLALVGGTGVGKSSLLNALAGSPVSRASVRRPTTAEPVAWVPREARGDLEGLLGWLHVREIREHDDLMRRGLAILDLPDMDSVAPTHRQRVEELLPRVDAVVWVTDPEKYHDAVLHDDFLREWLPRLDHQTIVLNKSDRLAPEDIQKLRRDLEQDLTNKFALSGRRQPPVIVASAIGGNAELRELRGWLATEIEAKRIVRDRLAATLATSVQRLARDAGVDPATDLEPFLRSSARRAAIENVTSAVLRAMDLPELERQAVAATRARARARGTGPTGRITSSIYRLSGRQSRAADPDGYLVRWREHGPLTPAVETLRHALTEAIRSASPSVRPALAASVEPARIRRGLEESVDRAIGRHEWTVPSSRVWPVISVLQTLTTGAIALSVLWIVLWVLARPPVATIELPVLGPVPMPLVALVASLVVGYLLARTLGLHAGWVGRRWAARLRGDVATTIERELVEQALQPVDRLEAARRSLWSAARGAIEA